MLNENAQKWVAELRAGKRKQAQGMLHSRIPGEEEAFCCLGVACDMFAEENPQAIEVHDYSTERVYDGRTGGLPLIVQDWLGLRSDMGYFTKPDKRVTSLAGLNDEHGYTFEQIADVIESEPEGLFVDANTNTHSL